MIDLISNETTLTSENVDVPEKKYGTILEGINDVKIRQNLANIYNVSVEQVNEKYDHICIELKAWSIIIVRDCYFSNKIKNSEDVTNILDGFFEYVKENYDKYLSTISVFSSDYDRDKEFVYEYINKIK